MYENPISENDINNIWRKFIKYQSHFSHVSLQTDAASPLFLLNSDPKISKEIYGIIVKIDGPRLMACVKTDQKRPKLELRALIPGKAEIFCLQ